MAGSSIPAEYPKKSRASVRVGVPMKPVVTKKQPTIPSSSRMRAVLTLDAKPSSKLRAR